MTVRFVVAAGLSAFSLVAACVDEFTLGPGEVRSSGSGGVGEVDEAAERDGAIHWMTK